MDNLGITMDNLGAVSGIVQWGNALVLGLISPSDTVVARAVLGIFTGAFSQPLSWAGVPHKFFT